MVTLFGLGFVGLTTALGFAEMGQKVYGVEINKERMDTIKAGKLPFLEPGLDKALKRHLGKNFIPCDDLQTAINDSKYVYYCVGTPYGAGGQADLTYLFGAIEQTLSCIHDDKYRVLVTKSTVPPSTTSKKIIPFLEQKGWKTGQQIGIANNPEFLREGHCWDDFTNADRIVLGVSDDRTAATLKNLYKDCGSPVCCVSLNTGEFIKYLSNTLLATMVSYANEMSIISDTVGGIDTAEAFRILLMDGRWGNCDMKNYVYPGCGYGGYCLPKDTNALYSLVKSMGFDAQILKNVIKTNDDMPKAIASRIAKTAGPDKKIGILGLSFKPLSDDVRDTPSSKIIKCLQSDGYKNILGYDPVAVNEFKKHYLDLKGVCYCKDLPDIINKADVLVIATAWDEFKDIRSKTDKPIVDCRFML
jgi:UDPglucose 6-dehydrogenase